MNYLMSIQVLPYHSATLNCILHTTGAIELIECFVV